MSIELVTKKIILTFEDMGPLHLSNVNFPLRIVSEFKNKLKIYEIKIHDGGMQLKLISTREINHGFNGLKNEKPGDLR